MIWCYWYYTFFKCYCVLLVSINIFIEYPICWIVVRNYFIPFVLSFFNFVSNLFCFCKFISTFTCFSYWCVTFYLFNISVFILVNKCYLSFLDSCVSYYVFVIFICSCCYLYWHFFYTCNVSFFLRYCKFWKISTLAISTFPIDVNWFVVNNYRFIFWS